MGSPRGSQGDFLRSFEVFQSVSRDFTEFPGVSIQFKKSLRRHHGRFFFVDFKSIQKASVEFE